MEGIDGSDPQLQLRDAGPATTMAAKLKWGKRSFDLVIEAGSDGEALKQSVESITGVPADRQKLLCTKLWKGAVKNDSVLQFPPSKGKAKPYVVTLIGSAEKLIEKSIDERPLFEEDLTEEEVWRLRRGQDADAEMASAVDIVALQREVGMDRDDGKADAYQCNRLVIGLPQSQINDTLVKRKDGPDPTLKGEEAMTLGMELRRAYIASIAVLPNGTVVSGSDDGHLHLWCRCNMLRDVRHAGSAVDIVAAFPPPNDTVGGSGHAAFVSSGAGSVCLWTSDGDPLARVEVHPGTTPASLTTGRIAGGTSYMAACFRVTRESDPGMFRLVPQNEAERQRRREAMDREEAITNQLVRESRLVRVWFHSDAGPPVQEVLPAESGDTSGAVTCLLDVDGKLVCADETGCLRLFEWTHDEHRLRHRHRRAYFQFRSRNIACMERIKKATVAVSVTPGGPDQVVQSASQFDLSISRGVCVVDLDTQSATHVLDGHNDTVMCMCSLPDGSLLTGGGKLDATVKLWSRDQLERDDDVAETKLLTEARKLDKPGYVFDMRVLPDSRGSGAYAIACARYNVVKIII